MSAFIPFGSSAQTNPNVSYEARGFGTDGSGITCTAGSANAKGSATATLGTTSTAWTGLNFFASNISGASQRWLFDISFDGGSTWAVQNYFAANATAAQQLVGVNIPIIVPASSDLRVRAQSSTGSATCKVAIEGVVGGSTNAPGFSTFTNLLADTTNTRPSTIDVPFASAISGTGTTLIPSTAATYGAILAVVDGNASALGTAQAGTVVLATGAGGAETELYRWMVGFNTVTIGVSRGNAPAATKSVASSTRLSAQILVTTAGSDNGRVGLYGLS